MNDQHTAYFDPTPRWKRRLRNWRRDLWFRMGYPWRRWCYRLFSRLIHRFGFHHMERNTSVDPTGTLHWCHWCGIRCFEKNWRDNPVARADL